MSGGATFGSGYTASALADGNVAISGNLGIGTTSHGTKLDVAGALALRGASFTAGFTITGIAGGTDGRLVILVNMTTNNMSISGLDILSLVANRIITGKGITPNTVGAGSATFIYSSSQQRWLMINLED